MFTIALIFGVLGTLGLSWMAFDAAVAMFRID